MKQRHFAYLAAGLGTLVPWTSSTAVQAYAGAAPQVVECSNISPTVQRACIGRRVEAKSRLLDQLYTSALAAVRAGFANWGRHDQRMDPRHFVKAHREWRQFIGNNCTAVGAFGGGSNSSISDRITDCYERALDGRIQLYRQIADGTLGS